MLFLRLVPAVPFAVVNVVPAILGVSLQHLRPVDLHRHHVPGVFRLRLCWRRSEIDHRRTGGSLCRRHVAPCGTPLSGFGSLVTPEIVIALVLLSRSFSLVPVVVRRLQAAIMAPDLKLADARKWQNILDSRSVHHRRRLRRTDSSGGGARLRRLGGSYREGRDGRRLPQHRLCTLEIADCRGAPRRYRPRGPRISASVSTRRASISDVSTTMSPSVIGSQSRRNDSVERFEGLGVTVIQRRRRALSTPKTIEADGQQHQVPAAFIIAAGSRAAAAADPRHRHCALSSPMRRSSI